MNISQETFENMIVNCNRCLICVKKNTLIIVHALSSFILNSSNEGRQTILDKKSYKPIMTDAVIHKVMPNLM